MIDDGPIILYGAPQSLYAGRARSYMIKAGIDYRERPALSEEYVAHKIYRKAGERVSLPTIMFPDGRVIRDGVAIVDHFECERGYPSTPRTPKQNTVSLLLDAIGAEGLLRPAMHYRFGFMEQREHAIYHFQYTFPERETAVQQIERTATQVTPLWGVQPEYTDVIESLYEGLLVKMEAHFAEHPYFLGGKPCVGDFGMIAPLFGHLGRDPVPLSLMVRLAIHLYRWVERMNRRDSDIGEYHGYPEDFLPDDEVPKTLIEVLKHLAIDFVPETRAAGECINRWLVDQSDLEPGTACERGVGEAARFDVKGRTMTAMSQPFRFYMLERMQYAFETLESDDRRQVRELLDACDMSPLLDMKLSRRIGRSNNREVWLV